MKLHFYSKSKRVFLFLFAGIFHFFVLNAQTEVNTSVSGLVKDSRGEPVAGASVVVKGTTNGTITGNDGIFRLNVPEKGTLIISFLGFIPKEIKVNSEKHIEVILEENQELLDEVVVIGYGQVKKGDITGSLSTIKPDEINKGNRITAQDALVGKIAGVYVVPGTGAPGTGATIRIRSGSSLSASNDPLIVIDGVPVDNSGIEGSDNLIGSINPNDIETFTILKDASATAIYGSRASNGVIIITTKKGDSDKLKFNYSNTFSVSAITDKLDVLSAEEFKAFVPTVTGVPNPPDFGNASTDWQDEVYRTAFGQEHNFSLMGRAAGNAPYRVSVGYTDQNGIIKTNNYKRSTFSGSITPTFFDKHLSVGLNAKLSYEDDRKVNGNVFGDVISSAITYDPTRPVKTGSATWQTDPGLGYFMWINGNSPITLQTDNPVALLELQDQHNDILRSIGNAAIDYKVHGLEDLRFNLNLGYDVLNSKYANDVPDLAGRMYTSNIKNGTGLAEHIEQDKRNYLLDFYANYTHEFAEKHALNVMGGYGWQHFWKRMNSSTEDTKGNELASPKHSETEHYLLSFYGRLNYTYDNRYLLTTTLRSDASSRFSKNNRWGLFPSMALGWRISQEDFLLDSNVLSDLKLRLSYGVTGQQDIINDYPYMSSFSVSYPESSYQFGDQWYLMYRPDGYDPDIKWETTTTRNVGVDYGFLGNRIYGSIDYYQRFTKDLLNQINVISGTNYSSVIFTNIGEMKNKGWEFSINAIPVHTKDFEWTVGLNYTATDSKITKLNVVDSESTYVAANPFSIGKFVQVFMVDQTPYTYYMAKQAYDDAGKPLEGQYVQPDGSISNIETRYATGKSALPTSLLGFNTHFSYRNWDLALSGHGAFGNTIYSYVHSNDYKEQVYTDQGTYLNILKYTRDKGFDKQQYYTDYFLEDGSFFRFDNVTLGYTFHKLWNNTSSLQLSLGIQNIATITGYSGIDPELYDGIDRKVYQRPRIYTFSMNLTF